MNRLLLPLALLSVLATGAIFGFFFAWICSTMWGLDAADPSVAIAAMQAMNASVRNAVFAPAFFGTPLLLLATSVLAWRGRSHASALLFLSGGLIYLLGALALTATVNVPMNEALAEIRLPLAPAEEAAVWSAYSSPWQSWNVVRTIASGLALLLAAYGLFRLERA